MARKTLTITIDTNGRDQGKTYLLREMPSSQAEKWAARALLAMAKSGVEVPDDIATAGLAGVAALGIKALGGMAFEDAEPLLDEMFACISFIPDPSRPQVVRGLIEDDIEEISTRLRLRKEVFFLHVNFSMPAAGSISTSLPATGAVTPSM
jgi:hypothetical protein